MTKTFPLLAAALLCSQSAVWAQAQNAHPAGPLKQATANPATAGKTTANASRLVAVTTRMSQSGNLDLMDSTQCYYPSGLGYNFLLNDWKYDNAMMWEHDGSAYNESFRISNTFDAANRTTRTHYEVYGNGQWYDNEFTYYTYDAGGNIATEVDAYYNGISWDSTRLTNTYNSGGQLLVQVAEAYNATSMQWENNLRFTHTYTGSQLATTITEMWNNSQWANSYRTTNTYVSGQLTMSVSETWNSAAWQNSAQTLYTYNSAGQVTVAENFYWNSNVWAPVRRTTHTYSGAGDVSSTTYEMYVPLNGYENQMRTLMSYNGYHQSTVETNETWDAGQNKFEMNDGDDETRNYYEVYTESVKDNATAAGSITVYPVPAKNVLNLRTAFGNATAAQVTMTDMSGRVVRQLQLPTATQYNTTIDVAGLPSGTYTLSINAAGKLVTKKVMVGQ